MPPKNQKRSYVNMEKIHLCFRFSALAQTCILHVNYGKARSDIPENIDFVKVSLVPLITQHMISNVFQ